MNLKSVVLKHVVLIVSALAISALAYAQGNKPTPPTAADLNKLCDVTYSMDMETKDNQDVGSSSITLRAVPWVDVQDNHKKQLRILDALSKEQDKGGDYEITVTETNTCDGGPTVRIASGSALILGVTLEGSVRVGDIALQVGKEINDRYRGRASKGAKVGWDHSKAQKVLRDDLGRRIHKKDKD